MPSRVTAVVRYALESAMTVPACSDLVMPRNASCTMSSASPTEPVIPYAMENSSGRYWAAAPASAADPVRHPLSPAPELRPPAECLLRLRVRRAALHGHGGDHETAGQQPAEPGR